jgi:hypothetical protein
MSIVLTKSRQKRGNYTVEETSKVLLGKLGTAEGQHLKNSLSKHGFEIALVHNHESCKTGCSPQVEVWVHPEDANEILQTMTESQRAEWESNGYDVSLANQVYNPEAESATCPACGTAFSPTLNTCPDCGLCF